MIPKAITEEAYWLLHEGSLALAKVERTGMRIDTDYLERTIGELRTEIKQERRRLKDDPVFKQWTRRFGEKSQFGSKQQLGAIVFRERDRKGRILSEGLGYDRQPGTSNNEESAFEHVDHPWVRDYIALNKLIDDCEKFLVGIQREVVDGYLHPVFNLHIPVSFRSSGDSPNPQNWPIRIKERAKRIRSCFIPWDNDFHIVESDFSGIEVKVAGCYNRDKKFIYDVLHGDMHRDLAAECYMIPTEQVTKDARYCAKNQFVFPEFYGDYFMHCAPKLWESIKRLSLTTKDGVPLDKHLERKGIKELGERESLYETSVRGYRGKGRIKTKQGTFIEHIRKVEDDFWNRRYKVYKEWKDQWYSDYCKRGGFQMATGFWCGGLMNRKECINYPIQGAAFHCLLWSLIQIVKILQKRKMRSRVIGQIHDSVISCVHKDELHDYINLVHDIMTVKLLEHWDWITLPLAIEVEVAPAGQSWFEKQTINLSDYIAV